jgi:hypothetical protein
MVAVHYSVLRIRRFIPDRNLSIPGPGVKNIPDPGSESASKNFLLSVVLTTVYKLSEKLSGIFIPDPDFFPSRIQGTKKHRIPDPQLPVIIHANFSKYTHFVQMDTDPRMHLRADKQSAINSEFIRIQNQLAVGYQSISRIQIYV